MHDFYVFVRPFERVFFMRWDFCLLHHLPGPVTFSRVGKPMRTVKLAIDENGSTE